MLESCDAVVVGSGPNGLAAAIELARSGLRVRVVEAKSELGGGTRTIERRLADGTKVRHDLCSAIHPMGIASPYFRSLPLHHYGLEWIHPPALAGQAMEERSVCLYQSIAQTAEQLDSDQRRYFRFFSTLCSSWPYIDKDVLGPLGLPRHPLHFLNFAMRAPWPASWALKGLFGESRTQALLGGVCAHSTIPLHWAPSFAAGLVLTVAGHQFGWPLARGGSGLINQALISYLRDLGGTVHCDVEISDLQQLPPSKVVLLDITPRQFLKIPQLQDAPGWGARLYRHQLQRYRHGPGSYKVDYILSGPIPWKDPVLKQAGTVHLGGTLQEIAQAEHEVWQGKVPQKPYVLVAQQSLFDSQRVEGPTAAHNAWAYCHVPHGCDQDALDVLEAQLERFAPGFRDLVLDRLISNPATLQNYNANYIGGDISGGSILLSQLFTRPVISPNPYATPLPGVFLCSSSTPPGGGVHGMCGYHAARRALKWLKIPARRCL